MADQPSNIKFENIREFTPIPKGDKARMFFSLSKLIDMSKNNREFLFLKLTEQYKSEDGKWHYSKKNPTIRPQDIPAMIEAMHELDDYFNRGGDSEPENKGSDLPEDPFD